MPRRHDPHADPWERQPNESEQAFAAFVQYRDMGEERSISNVAKKLDKHRRQVAHWCTTYHWTERVRHYTNHLDRLTQAEIVRKQKAARERHASIASAHLAVLSPLVSSLADHRSPDGRLPNTSEVRALARLVQLNTQAVKHAVEVERLSLGMPSMHTALSDPDGGAVKLDLGEWLRQAWDKSTPQEGEDK